MSSLLPTVYAEYLGLSRSTPGGITVCPGYVVFLKDAVCFTSIHHLRLANETADYFVHFEWWLCV